MVRTFSIEITKQQEILSNVANCRTRTKMIDVSVQTLIILRLKICVFVHQNLKSNDTFSSDNVTNSCRFQVETIDVSILVLDHPQG